MTIKTNLYHTARNMKNFAVQHKKQILPYGAVFVCLTGLWLVWEGRGEEGTIIRETKSESRSSSSVFSHAQNEKQNTPTDGTLVMSTAGAIRQRPLPDLFARSAALTKTETTPVRTNGPAAPTATPKDGHAAKEAAPSWPLVVGTMQSGAKRFVVLKDNEDTKICAPGEQFHETYVAYIHEWAVGLSQGEHTIEIPL